MISLQGERFTTIWLNQMIMLTLADSRLVLLSVPLPNIYHQTKHKGNSRDGNVQETFQAHIFQLTIHINVGSS